MESRLRLNAEQRRQLEVLDLSRPVPVPGRRNITPRVMSIVLVANDLARRDLPVCAATVRAGLVALGECTGDTGNQALGDVLGSWGLDLSRESGRFRSAARRGRSPSTTCPWAGSPAPTWRRSSPSPRVGTGHGTRRPTTEGTTRGKPAPGRYRAGGRGRDQRRARPGEKPAPGRYRAGGRGRDQSTPPGSQLGRRALPGAVVKAARCAGARRA